MRIVYFVQYFNLPDEPGGSRAYQFARAWCADGHQVTVVTGAVNHKTLSVAERHRGRLCTEELIDGIRVLRVWSYAGIKGSFKKRLLNFISYAASATLVGLTRVGPADLVYASTTPLPVGIPGLIASFVKGARFVFEVRDLWPQSAIVAGILRRDAVPTRIAAALARFLYGQASRVVAVTRGIGDGLVAEGVSREKLLFIPNGVDDWMVREASQPLAAEPSDRFEIVYCGAHGKWNGLGQILDAAERLREMPGLRFEFIGDGDEREALAARAAAAGLSGVRFRGALPKTEAFRAISAGSASIVVTWADPFQKMVLANKIFDYLAAGRPVIVAAEGEMAELVQEAGCGLVVPPEQPERLAEAIAALAALPPAARRSLGERGRAFILARYQREALARDLLRAMEAA